MARKIASRKALVEKMMRLWSEYHHTPPENKARRRHLKRAAQRCAAQLRAKE